jgi:hypothetical protein
MNELIAQLVKQLGVQEGQAKGGAGLLFKLAQQQLGGDFSQIAGKLGGVEDLIKSAPQAGGAASLLGGLAKAVGGEKLGGLAQLAGGFSQLKLDQKMIGQFIPIVLNFVQSKAGQQAMATLAGVLKAK